MANRDKVFDALRNCITEPKCRDCPWDECERFDCKKANVPVNLLLDVLNLLKEQEAVEPTVGGIEDHDGNGSWWYQCGKCKMPIDHGDKFCRRCGQEVKWK